MNFKSLLFRLLGMENYLRVVSKLFFFSYKTGRLKKDPDYYCHYFAKTLISRGDTIVDIGGNLGYYSRLFGQWTGAEGKVISIEPVPVFRKVLQANTSSLGNITILPFALGAENGKKIEMGVPTGHKHFRHGLTHIISEEQGKKYSHTFKAEMRKGSDLLADLAKLDYLKMDVEGYEVHILPEIKPVILKHKPIIQVELGHKTRNQLVLLLSSWGYEPYYVVGTEKVRLKGNEGEARGDLIFFPN